MTSSPTFWQRLRLMLETIRFSHTIFALPFALLSTVLACYLTDRWEWTDFVLIVLCMVFARSTAMGFNRLADRHLDRQNPRTAGRALAAGTLSPSAMWTFTIVNAALFVVTTVGFNSWWPLRLSIPVLLFICAYSYTKRFTVLCHFWLGLALMLAPVCAWIAITGSISWLPVVLGAAVLMWVAGFDIIYACQDFEADRKTGLNSVPAKLGVTGALKLAKVCHIVMLGFLFLLPRWAPPLGPLYLIGVALIAVLLAYEHAIVRPDDLSRVNVAFLNVNAIISVGLLGIIIADLVLKTRFTWIG